MSTGIIGGVLPELSDTRILYFVVWSPAPNFGNCIENVPSSFTTGLTGGVNEPPASFNSSTLCDLSRNLPLILNGSLVTSIVSGMPSGVPNSTGFGAFLTSKSILSVVVFAELVGSVYVIFTVCSPSSANLNFHN